MSHAAATAASGGFPLLSLLIFLPIVGAVVVAFVPARRGDVARALGTAITVSTLGLAVWLLTQFETGVGSMQWVESHDWIPSLGIGYRLGVDGISLFVIALTALVFPLTLVASGKVTKRLKHYTIFLLLLEGLVIGVFCATDLFLFFVFWEAMLVPMYFLIGYWGSAGRVRAAVKFFIFTAAGSAFLFAAIVGAGVIAGGDFSYAAILDHEFTLWTQRLLFWGFTIAFLVKVPTFPLHTWLPDAHTEAPMAGSVVLAAVLLKMGTYGLIRFSLPLFPRAAVEAVPVLLTLSVIGIVYGALVAIRQKDAKRLIAYTSVSHLGFITLGIFAITTTGLAGGVAQMVNHGLSTGALFFLMGMLYERRHSRLISDYGGIRRQVPILGGVWLFVTFASAGLPGLNGFIGEMLTLFGTFVVHRWWAIGAAIGVILAAIYLLWMYQRMFLGPLDKAENEKMRDLSATELVVLVPLMVLMLVLGVYPKPMLERIEPSVHGVVEEVEAGTAGTDQAYVEPEQTSPSNPVSAVEAAEHAETEKHVKEALLLSGHGSGHGDEGGAAGADGEAE